MTQQTQAILFGYLRHLLTIGAGALVAKGTISNEVSTQAIGVIMALAGVLWSHYSKTPAAATDKDNGAA